MKCLYYVGRSYPHPEALEALESQGYKFGVFRDKSHPGTANPAVGDIVDLDFSSRNNFVDSLKAARIPSIDGLLCTYENYITYKSILAEFLNVPAMPLEAAEKCTDKYLMRSAFLKQNPAITPRFASISGEQEALAFASEVGYPLILKPANLVKSLLISRCNNQTELVQAYRRTIAHIRDVYRQNNVYDREPQLILEQFIVGKMCSVAAFVDIHGQTHFCDGICDLVSAQSAGFDDNFLYSRKLPADFDTQLERQIFNIAEQGVKALGMQATPAHLEIIYNHDTVKLVEIGARIGGYRPMMYSISYGIDMLEQEIKVALGETPNTSGKFQNFSAVYEIFPNQVGIFKGLANAGPSDSYYYYNLVAKPGDMVGPSQNGYKAPLRIAVVDSDLAKFQQQCASAEAIRILTK
jgi:hypothetical protein